MVVTVINTIHISWHYCAIFALFAGCYPSHLVTAAVTQLLLPSHVIFLVNTFTHPLSVLCINYNLKCRQMQYLR